MISTSSIRVLATSFALLVMAGQLSAQSSMDLQPDSFNTESTEFSSGTWLGCAVDATQCRDRAINKGYTSYTAQRSDVCPNAAKFGCWGKNANSLIEASESEEFASQCSNYPKPALCLSHRECNWNGSCVPR